MEFPDVVPQCFFFVMRPGLGSSTFAGLSLAAGYCRGLAKRYPASSLVPACLRSIVETWDSGIRAVEDSPQAGCPRASCHSIEVDVRAMAGKRSRAQVGHGLESGEAVTKEGTVWSGGSFLPTPPAGSSTTGEGACWVATIFATSRQRSAHRTEEKATRDGLPGAEKGRSAFWRSARAPWCKKGRKRPLAKRPCRFGLAIAYTSISEPVPSKRVRKRQTAIAKTDEYPTRD